MAARIPEWHLFRAFLAVVQEGSLSGAARILGTTQPTIGRQVASLEAAIGVKLFIRSIDGFSPTEAGLRVIPAAEAMSAAAEAAQRAASGEVGEEHGTVRVTASEMIGCEVLPEILHDFRNNHPGISVELVLSNRNEDLLRGEADVAIRMAKPMQGALVAKRVGQVDVGFYGHQRYLRTRTIPLRLQDLRQHALIGYDRNHEYQHMIEKMGAPFTRDMLAIRSDSDLAQLAALRSGLGIGLSQLGVARRDTNLTPVLHAEFLHSMDVWIAMHGDMRGTLRIRLIFDHLVSRVRSYADKSRFA